MRIAIGIDLGGTSIKGGLINEKGETFKKTEMNTGVGVGHIEVLHRISLVIKEIITDEVVGICIGSPGFIDSQEGRVLSVGGNIEGWVGTDIKGILSKEFTNIPIFVENDANVAGVCEGWIGAGKGLKSFLMITLGTGLGGCIYTEKEGVWHGNAYQGAELGHAILYPNGRACTCGQNGCSEQYISGLAIEKIYKETTGVIKKGKDIFKDAEINEMDKEIVNKFCSDLAIYLATLKNIFDPEGIIIGGGVINSKDYWWNDMLINYNNLANNPIGMKIMPAVYLNDAGMIGAGKIALDKTLRR